MGGAMDAKSGVFTSPFAGAYLFIVHACTHDMNKGLMTIRRNGNQVASFYDQNHDSNHKNSMVGQSVILELEVSVTTILLQEYVSLLIVEIENETGQEKF